VGELAVTSEPFRQWWAGHHVTTRTSGTVRLHHRTVGDLDLDFETLTLPDDSDQSLRIYSTKPGSPSHDALRLLSSWAHSESNVGILPSASPRSAAPDVPAAPTRPTSKKSTDRTH
jgi:hypothetical protein